MDVVQSDIQNSIYEEPECPLCHGQKRTPLYRRSKRTGSQLGDVIVSVAQCDTCGFIFNTPRIRATVLQEHYASNPLASGETYRNDKAGSYSSQINTDRAQYYASFLINRAPGRLLDVGCSVGGFLDALKACGLDQWQMCGLEPSQKSSAAARLKGYTVENVFLGDDHFPPHSFDAISMVSVLEHVPLPYDALKRIKTLLKPNGIVFVEVPSILHPELSLTGSFSLEHILHFSPGTLASLFHKLGWHHMTNDPFIEDHGLRLIGTSDLSALGDVKTVSYVDDPAYARSVVQAYAKAEQDIIEMIDRRVLDTLQKWKSQGKKIAIYGAGMHTLELMSLIDLRTYSSVILDTDPKKIGTYFLDFIVHAPDDIDALEIDAVLVSSQRFQEEIRTAITETWGSRVEIAVCYDAPNNTLLNLPHE